MGHFCGDRMGSVSGNCVGSAYGDRMGHFCGDSMGSVSGDRMGSISGDRMGSISGDRMGSVSGDRVGGLICYTEMRNTRGNLFMLTNITNTIIAITADSKNRHEDARRGKLCVHFNTLGESGKVAGGRVETLYFCSPPACGTHGARRAAAAAHVRAPVCGDRMGSCARAGLRRPHGIHLRPRGFRLRRPHGALLWPLHWFPLRRLRGALDMLHKNEEHMWKSFHVD